MRCFGLMNTIAIRFKIYHGCDSSFTTHCLCGKISEDLIHKAVYGKGKTKKALNAGISSHYDEQLQLHDTSTTQKISSVTCAVAKLTIY